jgi:acyl carrier protein
MTQQDIIRKLREAMKRASPQKIDWDSVKEDATIKSLGFDSLTILDLIYDIQQEFGIEFQAEEMVNIRTVKELADFLRAKSP